MKRRWIHQIKASIFSIVTLLLTCCHVFAAANPVNMSVVATMMALRAIPLSAASIYPNIQVADYYGTGTGCPINYAWTASSSAPDNGGSVINPAGNSGTGRWLLNMPSTGAWHSCWFGVKVDSPAAVGTGTDNTTQMQALLDGSAANGPNHIYLDSSPGNCIRVVSILTPRQGQIIEGDGQGNANSTKNSGSCVNFTGSAGGYAFNLQTPHPGLGTRPFESPKFRDFTINVFSTDAAAGGCIRLNSIAGGFTDDNTSQQPMVHPEFKHLWCNLRATPTSTKIGFQCSKCVDGSAYYTSVSGGLTGFDIEGPGTVSGTSGVNIKLARQGTFGNNNQVTGMQILGFVNFGQAVDSLLYNSARSSTIINNFFEQSAGGALKSTIHLDGGFIAGIYNNSITSNATAWLLVNGTYNNITAYGNGGYGVGINSAVFHEGKYNYSPSVPSVLSHYGNGENGDNGWPFNSVWPTDQLLLSRTQGIWSPNYFGVTPNGYGLSEIPVNSTFTFPVTGSNNYLEFRINRTPSPVGIFDLQINAWQTSGTGQITCQISDNGSPVGSPITQNTTAASRWYTLSFAQAVSTGAGARCWNSGTGTRSNYAQLRQINLVDH
jgi:hypothetical protein